MIITVASGKGGTGKTTVTAALARLWPRSRVAVDLDVEAPNLHLFLQPVVQNVAAVSTKVPVVARPQDCTGCGACGDICAFKAVVAFGNFPVVFPEMCHSCGGCFAVCHARVFDVGQRPLGDINIGTVPAFMGDCGFVSGTMRVGEAMSPPLIRAVQDRMRQMIPRGGDALVDAPPGTSCPAMQAVRGSDVVLLVTEPTPFGLHDLNLAWQGFSEFRVPMGVVLNRSGVAGDSGDALISDWCRDHDVPLLAAIPFSTEMARAYAAGIPADAVSASYQAVFQTLIARMLDLGTGGRL